MMRTPDVHGRLELTKSHTPAVVSAGPKSVPANAPGIGRIMFAVDDTETGWTESTPSPSTVPALARTALTSIGHFSRRFREAYGESPYSYLMTRRIERDMALLRRGEMSVTDACFAVGVAKQVTRPGQESRSIGAEPHLESPPWISGAAGWTWEEPAEEGT